MLLYSTYAAFLLIVFALAFRRRARLARESLATHEESVAAGMTQPPSLHPVVDPNRCIGCESCIHACPEFPAHQVLGLMGGKAKLVSPTDCIGHGACETVCPVGAISLVFGTAERGVDIPTVNPDFSTNVAGVYIAGELGGMGLIRNAIEQGRQAIAAVAQAHAGEPAGDEVLHTVIVGAGPAGIAATLGAMEQKLSHVTIEQDVLGGTVANFPRGKLVMTAPAQMPLVGDVQFTETTKETLISFWHDVHRKTGMTINCEERLIGVAREPQGTLAVTTDKQTYRTRSVLLAIGRRGTPRRLGCPGEDLPKVTYSVIDPAEFQGRAVLVVGGGDSALEAALAIAQEQGTQVTLSYRSETFSRAKAKNRDKIARAVEAGELAVLMSSQVTQIEPERVQLEQAGETVTLTNDAVVICAGGILPTGLLEEIGIEVETKYGTA